MRWASCGSAISWAGGRDMQEVIVFAEGQTEERFIKQVVAPSLGSQILLFQRRKRLGQRTPQGRFSQRRAGCSPQAA